MVSGSLSHLPKARWALMLVVLAALATWTAVANRPGEERQKRARQSLAEAGFPNARLQRGQEQRNMSRCHVGQLRRRGYASAWTTGSARGLFCLPADGRPTRIIIDRGKAA